MDKIYDTYSDALKNGGLFYFGASCQKHGKCIRSVIDRKCKKCKSEKTMSNRDKESHRKTSLESYHRTKDKETRRIKKREYYKNNKEALAKVSNEWQKRNPLKMRAARARRRAALINATPGWAKVGDVCKAIVTFYLECPDGFEVDHIVPLRGKEVCGLHVPWNLQYLTKSENSSKGNRLTWTT